MITTDPLSLPPMTSTRLTDYRDTDGYALPPVVAPGAPGSVAWTLARLGYSTRDDEKAA